MAQACCLTVGQRSRGQDHRQATQLVALAGDDGQALANALRRLLDVKDGAHCGTVFVGAKEARQAMRNARVLVEGAEVLSRK